MRAAWREAFWALRTRRWRAALAGLGVGLAAMMLATSIVVGDSLGGGFARSASAARLPDVIARFDEQPPALVAARVGALPDLETFTTRFELTNIPFEGNGNFSGSGVLEVLDPGRRGYAIVAGRDLGSRPGEVVLEQALARAWGLRVGSTLGIGDREERTPERVVGLSVAPDNVGFPLAQPRAYVSRAGFGDRGFGPPRVNAVELWLRDPRLLAVTLEQARSESYGLRGLRLTTRSGVRLVIDQAAGIVIALLVALSVAALLTAGVMLAASARSEVARRLRGIGVRRALGAGRGWVTLAAGLEAFLVAAPAAALGVGGGALVATGPSARLLGLLNELPPGRAIVLPLVACWLLAVAVAVLSAAWPVWRAAGRSPAGLLRGGDLARGTRRARRGIPGMRPGLVALGARLVAARRARLASTLVVLGVSAAFILLMLALAVELVVLQGDPKALGRRYALSAGFPAGQGAQIARIPGVAAAAPRYEVTALDSFSLGETIDVVAYPGDHTTFEAPPLVSGRRLRGPLETEVGSGLADVLGLQVGSTLALQLPGGAERRLRVAGIVSSLDHDGRVAFMGAAALVAADPKAPEQFAVALAPGANAAAVTAALVAIGATPSNPSAIGNGIALVGALTAILRAVIGVLLERIILGPVMSQIAAGYASLPLVAGPGEIALLVGGLGAIALVAVAVVSRQTIGRGRVIAGSA